MAVVDDRGARRALFGTLEDFQVQLGGRTYSTWKEVVVERALDAASGVFSVTVNDPWQRNFQAQDEASVRVLGRPLITGQIDAIEATLDEEGGTQWRYGGRDRTSDLVDCSATNKPGEWRDIRLEDLARALASPFGVGITVNAPTGAALPRFKLSDAESPWKAIERACRMRGLLCYADGLGGLVIEPPAGSNVAGAAEFGRIGQSENLISAKLSINDQERFSIYTIRGQQVGEDNFFGAVSALVEANSLDAGVQRFRPLVILAEGAVSKADAEIRAQWEATVRASRAHELVCTVAGWRKPFSDGVWQINRLVPVSISSLGIHTELLIVATTFKRGPQGTRTEITLSRPDAWLPQPEVPKKKDVLRPGGIQDD